MSCKIISSASSELPVPYECIVGYNTESHLLGIDLTYRLPPIKVRLDKTQTVPVSCAETFSLFANPSYSQTGQIQQATLIPTQPTASPSHGQLEQFSIETQEVIEKGNALLGEVREFISGYAQWKVRCNEYAYSQGNLAKALSFFDANHETWVDLLRNRSSSGIYHALANQLETIDASCKWMNCLTPLLFCAFKCYAHRKIASDLDKLQERFNRLQDEATRNSSSSTVPRTQCITSIEECMKQMRRQLDEDWPEALDTGRAKLDKLKGRLFAISLELWGMARKRAATITKNCWNIVRQTNGILGVHDLEKRKERLLLHVTSCLTFDHIGTNNSNMSAQVYREAEEFLMSLETSNTLEEVKHKLEGFDVTLPNTFEEWKTLFYTQPFRRYVVQIHYHRIGRKPLSHVHQVAAILKKHHAENQYNMTAGLEFVRSQLAFIRSQTETTHETSARWTFTDISAHFHKLHIHFDQLNPAPTNMEEWQKCVCDDKFQLALAKQWADYQESTGVLFMQAMRQTLLSKNYVEKRFLKLRQTSHVISLLSSLTQFAFFLPSKFATAASMLQWFCADLTKLGIPQLGLLQFLHPFYPTVSFKLDAIVTTLIEHGFAIWHKPCEYSIEGYKLGLQIRWLEVIVTIHYLILLSQQMLRWINARLTQKCAMTLIKSPLSTTETDPIDLQDAYETRSSDCRKKIHALQERLDQLKGEDVKTALYPEHPLDASTGLSFDVLGELTHALEEVDVDCFPIEVHEFIQKNFGLELTNSSKRELKTHLRKFFSLNETEAIDTLHNNHMNYCRSELETVKA